MIQRIQSLYLLLVGVLMIITACNPLMELFSTDVAYVWEPFGVNTLDELVDTPIQTWPVFIILLVSGVLGVFTILMFNHRVKQIRFSIFNILLSLGFYGVVAFYYFVVVKDELSVMSISLSYSFVLPFVAMILNWLAIRAIGSDEALVRSIDRIRPSKKK